MESETHSHYRVRSLDAAPVKHPRDEEEEPRVEPLKGRFSHEPTLEEAASWVGWKATDELGRSIGKVEDVYSVDEQPRWLLIRHSRSHHFLAPLADAIGGGDQVFLPHAHETLENAPEIDPGQPVSDDLLAATAAHYADH